MKCGLIVLSLFASLFLAANANIQSENTVNQSDQVRSITIESELDVAAIKQKSRLLITRSEDHYVVNGIENEQEVDEPPAPDQQAGRVLITHSRDNSIIKHKVFPPNNIAALLDILRSAPMPTPTITSMGLTSDWLAKHVDAALKSQKDRFDVMYAIPTQLELFRKTFINPKKVQKLLPDICNPPIPQDEGYRQINIVLKTESGTIFEAEAHSLAPLMVPWTIKYNGKTMKTWNIQISRAILKLIPKQFLNAYLLNDRQLEYSLAEATLDSIHDKWEMRGAQHYAPELVRALQKHYRLENLTITFDYDDNLQPYKKYNDKSSSRVFDSILSRPSDPKNLKIYFNALNEGRNAHAPDPAMVDRYVNNVLNDPWVARQISEHHNWLFALHITQHGSLTESGLKQFAMDMREAGHPELIALVRKHLQSISYVVPGDAVGYARWLIFPDHSAILWRAFGDRPREEWLGFNPKQFVGHDCDDDSGNCPAALIEPDGKIAPGYGRQ